MKFSLRRLPDAGRQIWERFLVFVQRRTLLAFILAAAAILALASLTFRIAEDDQHDALWRSVVYITSGMDVDPPETQAGQIAAAVILISGVVLVSLLTGYVASEFARLLSAAHTVRLKPPERTLEGHILIFGWGAKLKGILRELDHDYLSRGARPDDIVVVSEEPHLERGPEAIYKHVWHVPGRPTDPDVLQRTDLAPRGDRGGGARAAAILSDTRLPADEADRRSLLNVLAVEHVHADCVSLAEVQDDRHAEHFVNANVDDILLPNQYTDLLLARTTEFPGLAAYVDELLALAPLQTGSRRQRPPSPVSFYVREAARLGASGKAAPAAISECYRTHGVLIVGRLGPQGVEIFRPGRGSEDPIAAEDQLVVIARPREVEGT